MRHAMIVLAIGFLTVDSRDAQAIDPYAGNDPYWVLLHEPAVVEDLKLSRTQREAYFKLLDALDARFFPLRNKPDKDATAGMVVIAKEVRDELKALLQPAQVDRVNEILLQYLNSGALLRDDVRAQLRFNDVQRKRIKDIVDETETAIVAADTKAKEANSQDQFAKRFKELKTGEQKKLVAVLRPDQQMAWKSLLGPPFPLKELRRPAFKAPELVDSREWINSNPLTLEQLRGKVVVVHFYASGCINCIHNYPSYRNWQEQYESKNVVMVGVHTPETASERDLASVRRKAVDEKLQFPILLDVQSDNWNAWGNSMWPSVYLIDKRGYLRDFWPGELKWQGSDGEKYLKDRIDALLIEP